MCDSKKLLFMITIWIAWFFIHLFLTSTTKHFFLVPMLLTSFFLALVLQGFYTSHAFDLLKNIKCSPFGHNCLHIQYTFSFSLFPFSGIFSPVSHTTNMTFTNQRSARSAFLSQQQWLVRLKKTAGLRRRYNPTTEKRFLPLLSTFLLLVCCVLFQTLCTFVIFFSCIVANGLMFRSPVWSNADGWQVIILYKPFFF